MRCTIAWIRYGHGREMSEFGACMLRLQVTCLICSIVIGRYIAEIGEISMEADLFSVGLHKSFYRTRYSRVLSEEYSINASMPQTDSKVGNNNHHEHPTSVEEQQTQQPDALVPKSSPARSDTNMNSKQDDISVAREHHPPGGSSPGRSTTNKPAIERNGPVKKRVSQLGAMARKKRKSRLADMSADITAQPVKLNTLEKSKLDWEAYKGNIMQTEGKETMSTAEREELEAQTHGGGSGLADVKGYLHRKEFLDRVHDRINTQEYEARYAKK